MEVLAKVNIVECVSVLKVGKITQNNSICRFSHVLVNGSGRELGIFLKAKFAVIP